MKPMLSTQRPYFEYRGEWKQSIDNVKEDTEIKIAAEFVGFTQQTSVK